MLPRGEERAKEASCFQNSLPRPRKVGPEAASLPRAPVEADLWGRVGGCILPRWGGRSGCSRGHVGTGHRWRVRGRRAVSPKAADRAIQASRAVPCYCPVSFQARAGGLRGRWVWEPPLPVPQSGHPGSGQSGLPRGWLGQCAGTRTPHGDLGLSSQGDEGDLPSIGRGRGSRGTTGSARTRPHFRMASCPPSCPSPEGLVVPHGAWVPRPGSFSHCCVKMHLQLPAASTPTGLRVRTSHPGLAQRLARHAARFPYGGPLPGGQCRGETKGSPRGHPAPSCLPPGDSWEDPRWQLFLPPLKFIVHKVYLRCQVYLIF